MPAELGYHVFRSGVQITTLGPDVSSFLDLEMPAPGIYFYSVDAYDALGPTPPIGAGWFNLALQPMTVAGRDWYHDCFPTSNTVAPGSAAFDRATARVKTGLNLIPLTGNVSRLSVPGDTVVVTSGLELPAERMDLVFRIKPGPGNYDVVGVLPSGLRVDPAVPGVLSVPGDGSFWGQYLGANGLVGTPGGHAGPVWNPHVWNSARCDTAETNLFPYDRDGIAPLDNFPGLVRSVWATMYHESEPKFGVLGIAKPRCFAVDPLLLPTQANITCGTGVYPPAWTAAAASGFDPVEIPGAPVGDTYEYTKIILDNLLTPGSHVEYFLRLSDEAVPLVPVATYPDTHFVLPQAGFRWGSQNGQRWEHFGVLPDRWKNVAFGGAGMACMLVVDFDDSGADDRVWAGVADSLGATSPGRAGANSGWGLVTTGADPNDPAFFVAAHGGQPGTSWDYFKVRGSRDTLTGNAGSLGSRAAPQAAAGAPAFGRESRIGPTGDMLIGYYRSMMILTGGRRTLILGPVVDRGQNDVAVLEFFTTFPGGTPQPRGLLIAGNGFAESEQPTHPAFLAGTLGISLRNGNYWTFSGNPDLGADVTVSPPLGTATYGLANNGIQYFGFGFPDVLNIDPGAPEASAVSHYENFGALGPYVASVYKPTTPARPWVSLVISWDIKDLASANGISSMGRLLYMRQVLNNVLGPLNCPIYSVPLDSPRSEDPPPKAGLLAFRNNPLLSGAVTIRFALPRRDRVRAAVYDPTGRLIRMLANTWIDAGEHDLAWDATDARGQFVSDGIYILSVSSESGVLRGSRKVTVLR